MTDGDPVSRKLVARNTIDRAIMSVETSNLAPEEKNRVVNLLKTIDY